jgi:protein arginine kinase activator
MFQGRLGCADCYTAFREKLAPLIEKVHGASQHVGKIPSEKRGALSLRSELLRYRSQLRKAIEVENYEEAARLRDLIREVEKTMVKE